MSVAQMAVSLFAVNEGFIDKVEISKVGAFEKALHAHMDSAHSELMKRINETGDLNDEITAELKKGVGDFVSTGTW
jgi:F-type H+-transporting ATPase subunit alpha